MSYEEQIVMAEKSALVYGFFEKVNRLQTLGFNVRCDFFAYGSVLLEIERHGNLILHDESASLDYLIHKTTARLEALINE